MKPYAVVQRQGTVLTGHLVTTLDSPSFFIPDGERFQPTERARGPWNPNSLHGRVLGGLLGRTLEQRYCPNDFQFARLTIELFRQAPMTALSVDTELVRDGNRIRVADGAVLADGVEVARARGVMLKRAEQPPGEVWSPPDWVVPPPEQVEPEPTGRPFGETYVRVWETRPIVGGRADAAPVQKRAWLRETNLLVAGEALTPFVRCAVVADYTNPFANMGTAGLNFVNADITLYLQRLPVNEWVGFEVASHQSADGIAVGESTLYDVKGAIGKSSVCAVANVRQR